MTLLEKLQELAEDEYVYLGTESGSAWIYIGHPNELIANIDNISGHFKAQYQKDLENTRRSYGRMYETAKKQFEHFQSILNLADNFTGKRLEDEYNKLKDALENFVKTKNNMESQDLYLSTWVDMKDRRVAKSYKHKLVEPYGMAIIVSGKEVGRYWLMSELERDKKKQALANGLEPATA